MMCSGCNKYEASLSCNSVTINDDQSVDALIIEDFAESYYNESELLDMVKSEIADFNKKLGGEKISVAGSNLENGVISLQLHFSDFGSYNEYMPDSVYVGTVKEAYDLFYDFNRSLYVAGKEQATIGKNDLMKMGDSKLVIVNGKYIVRCPSKVLYYNQSTELIDERTVLSENDGTYFIIYK